MRTHWLPSGSPHLQRRAPQQLSLSETAKRLPLCTARPSRSKQRSPAPAAAVPHRREQSPCSPRALVRRPATSLASVRPHSRPPVPAALPPSHRQTYPEAPTESLRVTAATANIIPALRTR